MKQVPIMILSDDPSQSTGLARIARDLATLIAPMPEFRVATLGFGGLGSGDFPWAQYHMYPGDPEGSLSLPKAWDDWSRGERGILLTIWDLSRMLWLARPEFVEDEGLRGWLTVARAHKFKLWSYLPIDSTGPGDKLTCQSQETLLGIDRVLAYSPWAEGIVRRTIGSEQAEAKGLTWMPHGLGLGYFHPALAKPVEPIEESLRIGIVGTNQARKDWGLVAAICRGLRDRLEGPVSFWWHIDQDIRYWSVQALLADYDLASYVQVTHPPIGDWELGARYRECNLTLHPGLGEGFGFPIFESLACGVPAIHGDYAGGASLMSAFGLGRYLVAPVAWRLGDQQNCVRPVYEPADWVQTIIDVLAIKPEPEWLAGKVAHLSWMKLGLTWRRWLKEGL